MSETSQPPLAPRIKHNSDLCAEFIAKNKVTSRYPKVTDQVEVIPLELDKLVRFAYNPSIIGCGDHLLMAYRYHDGDTLATKLGLAEVAFDGKVISNRTLDTGNNEFSHEDPRLFRAKNKVMICWVESTWPNYPLLSSVKYGEIEDNKIVHVHQPTLNFPKKIEKNWVPMTTEEGLVRFIYESDPIQVIFEIIDGKICHELLSDPLFWPYGAVRGGTVPMPYGDKLLRFFHSSLDNEFPPQIRRYYVGAVLMEDKPPFKMVQISRRPILYGSEIDNLSSEARRQCRQYKRQVVFPAGAGPGSDCLFLSVGVNDSACALLKIRPDQLNL